LSLDLDLVRERFESSTDFTIGLEEEFAILDPASLELAHRFEDVYAACQEDEVLAEAAAVCDRVVIIVRGKVRAEERPGAAPDLEARFLRLVGEAELDEGLAALDAALAIADEKVKE